MQTLLIILIVLILIGMVPARRRCGNISLGGLLLVLLLFAILFNWI